MLASYFFFMYNISVMIDFREELKRVPEKPGVYLMHDKDGTVIYVGKAVVLKNRLSSYFHKGTHNQRITNMIALIHHFEYIVTDSEYEALVLECNLIKKYSPKYNVLLKDDKGFPYIKVTLQDEYPKVQPARKIEKDGSKYFGPFLSMDAVNKMLDALQKIFPLRLCRKKIIPDRPERPCLNYHIGLCCGPCRGQVARQRYMEYVDGVCDFLGGKQEAVRQKLEQDMRTAAENMRFEQAATLRDKLKALARLTEEQKVEHVQGASCDVISVAKNAVNACIQIFFMRNGKILGREFFIMEGAGEEDEPELIQSFIEQYYGEERLIPSKIYTDPALDEKDALLLGAWLSGNGGHKCSLHYAQRGDMRKISEMVKNNAAIMLLNFESRDSRIQIKDLKVLEHTRQILQLPGIPRRIEAYDISNQGDSEINASMVVFTDGKPCKQEYRRFRMKEILKRNDVGSMREVLTRRFTHLQQGDKGFDRIPDLILIDGGFGQTDAAKDIVSEFGLTIPVFGMVKDDRHRTRALVGDIGEYRLREDPELWHFISSIQDEAHRFAIAYNRKLSDKRYRKSVLDDIPGIGKKRKFELLKYFGSFRAIQSATPEELAKVPGMNRKAADSLFQALQEKQ